MEGEKTAIKMKTGKHAKTRTQEKVRTGHMGKHKYRFFFKNTSFSKGKKVYRLTPNKHKDSL